MKHLEVPEEELSRRAVVKPCELEYEYFEVITALTNIWWSVHTRLWTTWCKLYSTA
jgi:hypothetical protein